MEGTKTHEELRSELLAKAAEDDGFRAKLVEDPRAAIKGALGLDLPDAISVQVHEEQALTAHIVLPPSTSLTESDLEGIAAGHESGLYESSRVKHRHGDGPYHY